MCEQSGQRWNQFWSTIDLSTAALPWNTPPPDDEPAWLAALQQHATTSLPLVDVACGHGEHTRWLAAQLQHATALGVDVSPAAVEHAAATDDTATRYRTLDILNSAHVAQLSGEYRPCLVHARFLMHLHDQQIRLEIARNLAMLAGHGGIVFSMELATPDQTDMGRYATTEPAFRMLLELGLKPGKLEHAELVTLLQQAGMWVHKFQSNVTPTASSAGSEPIKVPVEWAIAGRRSV